MKRLLLFLPLLIVPLGVSFAEKCERGCAVWNCEMSRVRVVDEKGVVVRRYSDLDTYKYRVNLQDIQNKRSVMYVKVYTTDSDVTVKKIIKL